jgi:Tfp pilus assembly protein PilX
VTVAAQRQHGATLFITLIMLVVLTLFALSAFNLSSVNLKIVGNYQTQKETEALVSRTMEQVLSTVTLFTTPAAVCLPSGAAPSGTPLSCGTAGDVLIEKPHCNYTAPAKGYTKKIGELTPEDTSWEVRASYTDPVTKAATAMVQGVGVRMLAGNCQP